MTRPEYEQLAQLRTHPPAKPQTNIPLIEEDEATGETAAAYQYFRDQTGRADVPGILKCFGTDPAFVRFMVDVSSTLLFADGHLNRRQKEMLATYISQRNTCPYCADSHGFFLLVHGATEALAKDILAGNLDTAELSEAERELLLYAAKVDGESWKTTREDAQHLLTFGWTHEQITEAIHVTAVMGLCNRVANAFGLPSQGFLNLKREGDPPI